MTCVVLDMYSTNSYVKCLSDARSVFETSEEMGEAEIVSLELFSLQAEPRRDYVLTRMVLF